MNRYLLKPIPEKLNDNAWKSSTYQGVAEVIAKNENEAREICKQKTEIGYSTSLKRTLDSPWVSELLVNCKLVEENVSLEKGIISPNI